MEYPLYIYEEEEDRDSISIKLVLKKFQRLFKFLYTKYSATGFKIENIWCFEDMKDRKETMNLAEMYKMLKDHGISSKVITKN